MINLEKQKEYFKNHIATFSDYENIKILDFKAPNSSHYRIRFIFEEDYCRLHISGDLGELIASNSYNMTFDKFSDFVNDVGYLKKKIRCSSRDIYTYDVNKAEQDLKKLIQEYDLEGNVLYEYDTWDKDEENINDFIEDVLEDFDNGIRKNGYDRASKVIDDFFEDVKYIGRQETGILDLYMLAFKLAVQQLKDRNVIISKED
jgi:hypothetical protein